MANWQGAARSNYVRIKDMEALETALRPFPIKISEGDGQNVGKVCFLSWESGGGWPSFTYCDDEDGEREVEFDVTSMICPYMEPGQVLVLVEAGHEKLCYVSGWAMAFDSEGNSCTVTLDDIYLKAAECFGVSYSDITNASD